MAIPKILHQTWKTHSLPADYQVLQQWLKQLHPTWEYRFYDDAACREVVRQQMPSFLPLYDQYPTHIQRIDVFRLVTVYIVGGFYLDLDIICHQRLDALCQHGAVFAEERTLSAAEAEALGHHDPLRVANYMFGSEARHPFMKQVLREIVIRSQRPITCENDVLESTGPGMLTTLYHRVKSQYDDVQLLRNHGQRCLSPYCQGQSCQFGYYASHLHVGSWRWQAS